MKRFTEYTDMELANMTSEELDKLIDIECMETGAPISVQIPVYLDVPEISEPTEKVYIINAGDIIMTSYEEAEKVRDFIIGIKTRVESGYGSSCGYDRKFVKPYDGYVYIKKDTYYSKEDFSKMEELLKTVREKESQNKERRKKYTDSLEKRRKVEAFVMDAYYEACDYKNNVEEAKKIYEKYIELADGNTEIAEKFFSKSEYGDYLDEVKEGKDHGTPAEL